MKRYLLIVMFVLTACSNEQDRDNNMEHNANRIADHFKDSSVNVFKKWGFFRRGDMFVWMRLKDGEVLYSFNYLKMGDTARITRGLSTNFQLDFPADVQIDTGKYFDIALFKTGNTIAKIVADDTLQRKHILFRDLPAKQLFLKEDPFAILGSLSAVADSLGIWSTFNRGDLGNFIELNLSSQHVLYYVPDNLWVDPAFKKVWLSTFSKGKTIRKNWILVKLDEPKDI